MELKGTGYLGLWCWWWMNDDSKMLRCLISPVLHCDATPCVRFPFCTWGNVHPVRLLRLIAPDSLMWRFPWDTKQTQNVLLKDSLLFCCESNKPMQTIWVLLKSFWRFWPAPGTVLFGVAISFVRLCSEPGLFGLHAAHLAVSSITQHTLLSENACGLCVTPHNKWTTKGRSQGNKMRKMEEDDNIRRAEAALSSSASPLPPLFLSPPPLPSLPTLSSPAHPPPSLAPLLRAAVYERVSRVWLHCSVEKGRAALLVRCAEGWCTRKNAFTRCVNLCLHMFSDPETYGTWNRQVFLTGIHQLLPYSRCTMARVSSDVVSFVLSLFLHAPSTISDVVIFPIIRIFIWQSLFFVFLVNCVYI